MRVRGNEYASRTLWQAALKAPDGSPDHGVGLPSEAYNAGLATPTLGAGVANPAIDARLRSVCGTLSAQRATRPPLDRKAMGERNQLCLFYPM